MVVSVFECEFTSIFSTELILLEDIENVLKESRTVAESPTGGKT